MKFFKDHVKPVADHYNYVLRHKWNIIGTGRKRGVPMKNLIMHDVDKLYNPKLIKAYSDFLYSPRGVRGANDPKVYAKFREQAVIHYKRSPHHAHKLGKSQTYLQRQEAYADWASVRKTLKQ